MNVPQKSIFRILAACTAAAASVFGAASCSSEDLTDMGSGLSADEVAYNGNIRISLSHPYDVAKDDYELLFAVPAATEKVSLCEVKAGSACAAGSPDYFETELIYATTTKRFYRAEASALLENGLTIKIMAQDASGRVTDTRVIEFSDGSGGTTPPATGTTPPATGTTPPGGGTTPPGGGTTPPGGATVSEAEAAQLVQQNCAKSCHPSHPGFTAAALKGNGSAGRIESGNMPPGGAMDAGSKAKLLQYLRQ